MFKVYSILLFIILLGLNSYTSANSQSSRLLSQYGNTQFYIETFDTFLISAEFDELGFPSKKNYKMMACLANSTNQVRLSDRNFKLKTGTTVQMLKTDHSGCLTWDDSVDLDYYSPEHYVSVRYALVDPTRHETLNFSFSVDPWME